ncbi:hypothetical protein M9Y10_001010 [Tritrichomonas musculus]|uniref:BEACH domain-containing protein n=1 Tax=Tritrichomonas musculus TaxID=1915356 RepID=A0ABR2L5U3_9EUKA
MKTILEQYIFQKNNIPLVKLINIRSDTGTQLPENVIDFRNDPLFLELPIFPTKNIKEFFNSLQNQNTIQKSLESLNFKMNFNNQFIEILNNLVTSKTSLKDVEIFCFLYQCLAFIRLNDNLREKSDYLKIFTIMNLCVSSPFHVFFPDIFKELLTDLLTKYNVDWDISLLNKILRQIVSNNSFDSSLSNCLESLISKIVSTKDSAMVETLLSVLVIFFEENKPAIQEISCSYIISSITNYISNLDLNSLVVLGYCSQKEPNDVTILYRYQNLIRNALAVFSQNPPFYQPSILFSTPQSSNINNSSEDGSDINDESTFEAPPENLIHCESNIDDICCKKLKLYSTRFHSLLNLSSKPCSDAFIQSIIDTQKIVEISVYSVDILILIASCLSFLSKQSTIGPIVQYFIKSKIFDPKFTIFSKEGLNPTISIIRNSIFKIISTIDSSFFYNFIQSATLHPLLLAEHIMRLSYKYGNMFFAHTIILNSLLASINVLQHEKPNIPKSHLETAKKVILSVVISLLDEKDFAFVFFSDFKFCKLFSDLLLEPSTTEIATSVFTKCVSKFPTLPDSTIQFISFILRRCNSNLNDEVATNGGISLVKAVISAISHKISLGVSVSTIFDDTLIFLKTFIDKNPETLEMTMAICALITQSQNSIEVTSERYNSILDIITKIEENEPSDSTLQSFLNQLNASTNTGIDQMFVIQTSDVIPIILAAFSQSKRLGMIIDLFQQLCLFSVKNIVALHDGDLSFILLKALVGPFSYKERLLNFLIPKEIIEPIFRLISTVVSQRSSFLINETFLNMIYPDPITHQFLPISEQAIMPLYQLFTKQDKSVFQICTEIPVYTIKDVDGSLLREGFAFSFLTKVDLTSILQSQGTYIYLEIKDSKKRVLQISQRQDSLLASYKTPTSSVLQTMTIPITSNKWVCITVFFYYEEKRTIVCFKAGNKVSDDAMFKSIIFEKDIDISIGFTKNATVPSSELSPVSMNHFALFLPPFDDNWFDSVSSNGFVELNHFPNIAFHSYSRNTQINQIAKRTNLSITSLMPLHTRISDFIDIFKYSHTQSSLFKEVALRSVFLFTNYMSRPNSGAVFSYFPSHLNQLNKLESFTHIPETVLNKFFKFNECSFSIHMSDLSIFFSSFVRSNNNNESFFLPIALELIELTTDIECHIELFESIILNIWLWSSSTEQATFKKNLRSLTHFLTQYTFQSNFNYGCLFSEFLIQAHFLCNYSTEQYQFIDSYRFRILESLPVTIKDIETIVSIIIYNYYDRDKYILSDASVNKYCITDEKRQSEIINYIEFLTLISSLKHITFQKKVLLALTDIVTKSSFQIVEKLVSLFKVAAGDNLHDCYLDIALKSDDIKIFDLLDDSFDLICIHTIKSQSIDRFVSFMNDKSKSMKNNELWWFWLSLTAAITQRNEIIKEIISNIIHNDTSTMFSFYSLFLSVFAILRLTKVFPQVNDIMNSIMSGVLNSIAHSSQTIPHSVQYLIAIVSLFASFHKLRHEWIPSKAILYLLNEFDDLDNKFKNRKIYHRSSTFDENTINNDSNKFLPDNFTLTNLRIIFCSRNLEKFQFKFWLSHTKPINMKNIRNIKMIIDFLMKSQYESFHLIKPINQFLTKLIATTKNGDINAKIDLSAAENVFPKLLADTDNNIILKEMKRQVSFCWNVIKSFITNSSHNFNYDEVFFTQASLELFRFDKLFTSVQENEKEKMKIKKQKQMIPISRFMKFPLIFRSKNKTTSNFDLETSSSNRNDNDNNNANNQSTKSEISLASSINMNSSSFSYNQTSIIFQPLLSFPCHIITINDPKPATFVILKNEFRLYQLGLPLIRLPFNIIKCITSFRTGFIEIFLSAFNSYLLALNTIDIENLLSYLNSFTSDSFANNLLPFPLISESSQIESKLLENHSLKSISVYDTVFSNILALNFAKGRSFNDLGYYPMFPLLWDGKFLSNIQTEISNLDYTNFLYLWLYKFYGIQDKVNNNIVMAKNKQFKGQISNNTNNNENNTNNNENNTNDNNNNNTNNNENNTNDNNNNNTNNNENNTNDNNNNNNNYTNNDNNNLDYTNENSNEEDKVNIEKVNFSDFLGTMPKCAIPHLFNCSCNFVNQFNDIDEHELIKQIYHNKKIIEKKAFRHLIAKWMQAQFGTSFVLKRNNKSLEAAISNFFEEKLSFQKKDQSRELVTLKKTKPIRQCKFFDGNKDAFACIIKKHHQQKENSTSSNSSKSSSSNILQNKRSSFLTIKVFSLAGYKNGVDGTSGSVSNGFVELSIQNYVKVPIVFNPDHDLLFCVLRHIIVVVNRTRCVGHIIFIPTKIYEFAIPTNITGICGIDDNLVLIIDNHIICAYSIDNFPNAVKRSSNNDNDDEEIENNQTISIHDNEGQIHSQLLNNVVACEDKEIIFFTSSTVFQVLVYQTCDMKLKVLSIFDSLILAEIQLSKRVDNLIITEENGFIMCKCESEIMIYTLNGNLISQNTILSKFMAVTQCRSPKGIDFILYVNEKGDLGIFEAISPSERKILLSGLKDVIEMRVCKRRSLLILISKSGEIMSFHISFKILFELCI